jgi:uncharacterized protein (UPF0332 family)
VTEEARRLLEKADRAIAAAERLADGFPEFAAGRAYYAMFYVAQALLVTRGLRFARHGGVHAAFGEHFVKTGELDPRYHRWLLDAFDRRVTADYGVEASVGPEEATRMIEQAREFLEAGRRYVEEGP